MNNTEKYLVKMLCWEYKNPTPYVDYILDVNGKLREFDTKDSAMVTLLIYAIEEVAELNDTDTEDSRKFLPDLNADHDCIICAWDGDDYMPVTAYDVVKFSDECLGTSEDKSVGVYPCEHCTLNQICKGE